MKKKIVSILLSALMAASLAAPAMAESATESTTESATENTETNASTADQEAADKVAALIDRIYVQERNETTDEDCAAAKAAWDALTDEQKQLVEGEEADFDYFGRDTGDASKDDPRNSDEIGEKEILVCSFGTSFNDSRAEDIKGIEDAIAAAYQDYSVRRAFTAQIIINHVQAREGEFIDNMQQALERAVANGVKTLVIQPTHLMHGAEYDELTEKVDEYADNFDEVIISEPLLGEVGEDASVINADKAAVAEAVTAAAYTDAGYESVNAAAEDGTAFVFMGHGTSHTANVTYDQMQTQMETLGYKNVFIGTVEGEPEDTACDVVIDKVKEAGYSKVILRPLMVVAGDHANNDMAGEDADSWKSMFEADGSFESVEAQIAGLGRIDAVQQLYVKHLGDALGVDALDVDAASEDVTETSAEDTEAATDATDAAETAALADGVYTAEFNTDSGMFHANESCDGKGTLTVENGKMTFHVSLASKKIVNLFVGTAEDAAKDGAELLQPTEDEVTYSDGMTEVVYGFDIPVEAVGTEFDCALLGTKGTWYDHKVSVDNPVPAE